MNRIDENQILFLMDDVEADFFSQQLMVHDAKTLMHQTRNIQDIEARLSAAKMTRIISFCSPHIVPPYVLKEISYNAFNFHPGPPDRPGYRPAFFAALDGATQFGVTFHQMIDGVDEGPIIESTRFHLAEAMSPDVIEAKAYSALAVIVGRWARELSDVGFSFRPCGEVWSGLKTTRRQFEDRVNPDGDVPPIA